MDGAKMPVSKVNIISLHFLNINFHFYFVHTWFPLDMDALLRDDVCFRLIQTIVSFTAQSLRVLGSLEPILLNLILLVFLASSAWLISHSKFYEQSPVIWMDSGKPVCTSDLVAYSLLFSSCFQDKIFLSGCLVCVIYRSHVNFFEKWLALFFTTVV